MDAWLTSGANNAKLTRQYKLLTVGRKAADGSAPKHRRVFLHFDLSKLAGLKIKSVTLRLYQAPPKESTGGGVDVHVLQGGWNEDKVKYDTPVGDSIGQLKLPARTGWAEIDVTAAVKQWQSDPSKNYGFCLKHTTGPSDTNHAFIARDGQAGHGPQLVIVTEP